MSQKTIEKLHKPNIVCIDISHPGPKGPTHEQQLELSDKIDTSLNELKQIYESIKESIEWNAKDCYLFVIKYNFIIYSIIYHFLNVQ